MRRILAFVALAGLALTGCSAGGQTFSLESGDGAAGSGTVVPSAATFQALPAQLESTSARFEMAIAISMDFFGEGINMSFPITGEFAESSMAMTIDFANVELSGLPDGTDEIPEMRIDYLVNSSDMYMHVAGDDLPFGDDWYRVDLADAADMGGDFLGMGGATGDPFGFLAMLEAADNVEQLGRDSIRGVDTDHYRVTVDVGEAWGDLDETEREGFESLLGGTDLPAVDIALTYDVWLDDRQRLRRVSFAMGTDDFAEFAEEVDEVDGEILFDIAIDVSMTIDVFDYDDASISVDPPSNAIEFTEDLADLLNGGDLLGG